MKIKMKKKKGMWKAALSLYFLWSDSLISFFWFFISLSTLVGFFIVSMFYPSFMFTPSYISFKRKASNLFERAKEKELWIPLFFAALFVWIVTRMNQNFQYGIQDI